MQGCAGRPSRYWGGRISELDRTLAELTDLTDRDEIARRVNALLAQQRGQRARENTARILRAALNVAPRVGAEAVDIRHGASYAKPDRQQR